MPFKPEDVLIGLLACLRRQSQVRFEADPLTLHPCFFVWRNSTDFGALLGDFVFDTRDYFPYSETLDGVLDGLQFAGYLERTNPRGTWYQITPSVEALFEQNVRSRFGEKELGALESLAGDFVQQVQTASAA